MADGQVDDLPINELKSLNCFGVFSNLDNAYIDDDDDELHTDTQAQAYFQRNVDIGGSLRLGIETPTTTNGVTTYTNTGGNILVKKNGVTHTLTPIILSYLKNISSDIQTQVNNINDSIDNIFSQDEILFDGGDLVATLSNDCIIDAVSKIDIGTATTTGTITIGSETIRGSILINNSFLKISNTTATGIIYLDAKTLNIGTSQLVASNKIYIGHSNCITDFKGTLTLNGTINFVTGTTNFKNRPTITFTTALPASSASNLLISKGDADSLYVVKTTNNNWTGTNAFNTFRPTSTLTTTPTTYEFITKRDADSLYGTSGATTLSAVQSNNNNFTGSNTFNTTRPSSTLTTTPTINQFITKRDADALYSTPSSGTTLSAVQSNNNTWTGTNKFNTSRPTSTLETTPTDNEFITKQDYSTLVSNKADLDSPIFENFITTPLIKFSDLEYGSSTYSGLNIIDGTNDIRYNVGDLNTNHIFSCADPNDDNAFKELIKINYTDTIVNNTLNANTINLNGVNLATTLATFITSSSLSSTYAPKVSPIFTGNPKAPTPINIYDHSTTIVTTDWVQSLITKILTTTSKVSQYIIAQTSANFKFYYFGESYQILGKNYANGYNNAGYLVNSTSVGITTGYGWLDGIWKCPIDGKYLVEIKFSVGDTNVVADDGYIITINATFYLKDINGNILANRIIYTSSSGNIAVNYSTYIYIPTDAYFYINADYIDRGISGAGITLNWGDSFNTASDTYASIKVTQIY